MNKILLGITFFLIIGNFCKAQFSIETEFALGVNAAKSTGIYLLNSPNDYDSLVASGAKNYTHVAVLVNYAPNKANPSFYFTTGAMLNYKGLIYKYQKVTNYSMPRVNSYVESIPESYLFFCIPLRINYEVMQKNNNAIILTGGG